MTTVKTPTSLHDSNTLLQLSMSWQQSPPMAIPTLATRRATTSAAFHPEDAQTTPQLSFEAREGQMLVQAYAANARIGADFPGHDDDQHTAAAAPHHEHENVTTPRPSLLSADMDADGSSLPDDEQDVFSLEL
ncbi:hypothetical protein H310_07451 [Aphanomyces invadans]|uniref:Uncharacterized protein n=1 Tax=Aphanomyces invadans TaxID=157072 RepID=A0A024U186_9STRA|nr:hypothetical protein H310_07451 [Aphanomyces invadans]ETW00009.1 hypothetical protein H310_07451 [Aphanomyces invadans]|eukprot:XP_008871034.1 hypothetical protein H310_07451 [Aphanomyces invadans]